MHLYGSGITASAVCIAWTLLVWYQKGHTIFPSMDNMISALSLLTFRQHLKTFLFRASFPGLISDHP